MHELNKLNIIGYWPCMAKSSLDRGLWLEVSELEIKILFFCSSNKFPFWSWYSVSGKDKPFKRPICSYIIIYIYVLVTCSCGMIFEPFASICNLNQYLYYWLYILQEYNVVFLGKPIWYEEFDWTIYSALVIEYIRTRTRTNSLLYDKARVQTVYVLIANVVTGHAIWQNMRLTMK